MFTSKLRFKKTVVLDVDKNLHQFYDTQLKQAKLEGKNITLYNTPKTETDLLSMPTCRRIVANFNSKIAEVGIVFLREIQNLQTRLHQYIERNEMEHEISESKREISDLEKQRDKSIEEAINSHNLKIEEEKNERVNVKALIKHLKIKRDESVKQNLLPKYITGFITVGVLFVGETIFNGDVFQYTGLNTNAALLVGLAVGTVTFMLGFAVANVLYKTSCPASRRISIISFILILVSCLYYTLGKVRVSMMETQVENSGLFDLSPFHFVVFNLAFFTAIFSVKYFVFPSPKKVKTNKKNKETLKNLQLEEKKLERLNRNILTAHQTREHIKKDIQEEFNSQIKELRKSITSYIQNKRTLAAEYNEMLAVGQNFYRKVNNDYKSVVATLFTTIDIHRDDGVSLPLPSLTDLENPFASYIPFAVDNPISRKQNKN